MLVANDGRRFGTYRAAQVGLSLAQGDQEVGELKDYARKKLGDLPDDLSLGQVLAYTGASSLTEIVRHLGTYRPLLNGLAGLGKGFEGALIVRADDRDGSLAVQADPAQPESPRVTTLQSAVENETSRRAIVSLLEDPQWEGQLQGSKLRSLEGELRQPGSDVQEVLQRGQNELEGGYTAAHTRRAVETVGLPLARELGLASEEEQALEEVANLYDIGKLAVSEEILNFPGRWPDDKRGEWFGKIANHVHPEVAGPLLDAFGVSDLGKQAVFYHHEKPEGRAYCNQRPWTAVPTAAKVLGMADTVDAMQYSKANHRRPEEATLSLDVIRERLSQDAQSGRVDGTLVEVLFDRVLA